MSHTKRYVIDADPGIDDAMAIIMALEEHRRGTIQVKIIQKQCNQKS